MILLPQFLQAQERKICKPEIHNILTFEDRYEPIYERVVLLSKKDLSASEKKELDSLFGVVEGLGYDGSVYETMGAECSWYCAGGPYRITASSSLKSAGKTDYIPANIHDFSYKTVWAEGVKGYGIGEYIEYHFQPGNTQITEIRIANGHVKSDKAWFENSRVKTIKMYFNGEYYLTLELNDTKALQSFKLDKPLGITEGEKDWVLKFEIADVYQGDKYDDVVISELFFDGIGDH
jgi:hypothetical protein